MQQPVFTQLSSPNAARRYSLTDHPSAVVQSGKITTGVRNDARTCPEVSQAFCHLACLLRKHRHSHSKQENVPGCLLHLQQSLRLRPPPPPFWVFTFENFFFPDALSVSQTSQTAKRLHADWSPVPFHVTPSNSGYNSRRSVLSCQGVKRQHV